MNGNICGALSMCCVTYFLIHYYLIQFSRQLPEGFIVPILQMKKQMRRISHLHKVTQQKVQSVISNPRLSDFVIPCF